MQYEVVYQRTHAERTSVDASMVQARPFPDEFWELSPQTDTPNLSDLLKYYNILETMWASGVWRRSNLDLTIA